MPNPRRRHSKGRGRRRRTHWKVAVSKLMECPQCKTPKMSHRICGVCGFYNGRRILDFEVKKAKKEERKKKGRK